MSVCYSDDKTPLMIGDLAECVGTSNWSKSFKLIRRKEEAAPSPAKAEPLVKWPEESHCPDFAHVPCKQLFVVKRFPQSVMYKDSKGAFHVIAGYRPDGLSDTDACRLLRVSTDTSSPFVVI